MFIENENKKNRLIFCIYIFLSFVLPVIFVFLIFLYNKMYGKDYIVMSTDLYLGVAGGLRDIANNIINHKNLMFSFSSNLGVNNALGLSTGVLSPFSFLYVLFYKCDVNIVTLAVICLKVGLVSVSFFLFSNIVLKNKNFFAVIISVFYSLSAYSISYAMIQISWLDTLYTLPLFFIAFYWFLKKGKRPLLIIAYTYLFITNFYLGYMVGVFSLVVFVIYIAIYHYKKISIKELINIIINWVLCVVISIMVSAVVWVPTLFFLLGNRAPDSTKTNEISISLIQVINGLFWGMDYNIEGTYSYIYSGLLVLLLIPLYFIHSKIEKKEKIFSSLVTAFLFLCTIFTPLNMLMHGFDQPDFFWFRYSFIFSFVFCAIASRYFSFDDIFSFKKYFIVIISIISFYLLVQQGNITGLIGDSLNNNTGLLVNLIFLLLWTLVIFIYKRANKKILFFLLSVLILGSEIVSNSKFLVHEKIDAKEHYIWENFMNENVDNIKLADKDLFRMINSNSPIYDSDSWFSYNGISDFGSQEKYPVRKFLSKIGFAASPRVTLETGYNPASEMILGVKYILNSPVIENDEVVDGSVFVNPYYLGIGYMVSGNVVFCEYPGNNVFENTNYIINSMTGFDEDCFYRIDLDDVIIDNEYMNIEENRFGQYIISKNYDAGVSTIMIDDDLYDEYYLQIEVAEPVLKSSDLYILYSPNMGKIDVQNASTSHSALFAKDGDVHKCVLYSAEGISPEYFVCDSINIYGLDKEILQKQYDKLSKGVLKVANWSDGYIDGHVSVSKDKRVLFTSIPYDPGWHAYIDGKEVETVRLFEGAFLGIMFPTEGDYNVSFKYEVPGLFIGKIVSLLGVVALLSVIFEKKFKVKK
ncbi:Uncharacterized membrane protein YfhO [Lachnospiraceae bacterium G41]|nr:Uncharacterized membrane protein YfhO [Lachnospiraceae bacterium G41]